MLLVAPRILAAWRVVKIVNCLYGTTGSALLCFDYMTCQVKWSDRCVGAASILYADGRLYLHGEHGEVNMIHSAEPAVREQGVLDYIEKNPKTTLGMKFLRPKGQPQELANHELAQAAR